MINDFTSHSNIHPPTGEMLAGRFRVTKQVPALLSYNTLLVFNHPQEIFLFKFSHQDGGVSGRLVRSFTCKVSTFKVDFHAKRVESALVVKHFACILTLLFSEKIIEDNPALVKVDCLHQCSPSAEPT